MDSNSEDPTLQSVGASPGFEDQGDLTKPLSVVQMVHLNGTQRLRAKGDSFGWVAVVAFVGQHGSVWFHLEII